MTIHETIHSHLESITDQCQFIRDRVDMIDDESTLNRILDTLENADHVYMDGACLEVEWNLEKRF